MTVDANLPGQHGELVGTDRRPTRWWFDWFRRVDKRLVANEAAVQAVVAAPATPPVTITGPGVTGSAESGYAIAWPESSGAVPLSIGEDERFTVAANTQVLYHTPIDVDGELVVSGELIEVG